MNNNIISKDFADFIEIEGNIIIVKFKFDGDLTYEQGVEIYNSTLQLANNKLHSIIYDFNEHSVIFSKEIKKEAQNRPERNTQLISRAFIGYNLSNKLEVNHFIKYNKSVISAELFNSLEAALAWSKLQLSKNTQ